MKLTGHGSMITRLETDRTDMLERSDRQSIGSSCSNKNPLGDQFSECGIFAIIK